MFEECQESAALRSVPGRGRFNGCMQPGLVVVVEDDPAIADVQRRYLSASGYGVHTERDGSAGLDAIRRLRPVAVVLDVGLPSLDGVEICRTLRAEGDWTPILFVTARDDEVDRVLGLELGGDDYLTKPFSPRELVARVKSVLRRQSGPPEPVLELGRVRLDETRREVTVDGAIVSLTATEFDLLAKLASDPTRVFPKDELLRDVWGYRSIGRTRTLDSHASRLRRRLAEATETPYVINAWGLGYRLMLPG